MHGARIRTFAALRSHDHIGSRDRGDHHPSRFRADVPRIRRFALWPGLTRMGRVFRTTDLEDNSTGPLPGGRQRASWSGSSDGSDIRAASGGSSPLGFAFDAPIPPNGYAWWYLDALSDDGQNALTIIALIGSVFSPYYAIARRNKLADPLNYCAMNVALYGPGRKHWAMTERMRHDVRRHSKKLEIGPSTVSLDESGVTFSIDEKCVPFPTSLKGTVRIISASGSTCQATALDHGGEHKWLPLAPSASVVVDFENPGQRWSGTGYLDCNFGSQPLENAFAHWNWSRAHTDDGAIVLYDIERRDSSRLSLAKLIDGSGRHEDFRSPPGANLPPTLWRVARSIGCDKGSEPRIIKTLEDTPFYARTLAETTLYGMRVTAIHESLSLDRFANPIVRAMLPFRMPRWRSRKCNRPQGPLDGS